MSEPSDRVAALETMRPGAEMATALAALHGHSLSPHDRVLLIRAHRRMASHHEAMVLAEANRLLPAFDELDDPGLAHEAVTTEVRAALSLTRRSAEMLMDLSDDLVYRLPDVWAALSNGDIDVPRARVFSRGTSHVNEATARAVADEVLASAPTQTTGQLGASLRKLCLTLDPDDATKRQASAVAERRVWMEPTVEGTAHIHGFDLPPLRAAQVSDHINTHARHLKSAGDTRTMDQIRADVFLDLLGGAPESQQSTVVITVDIETLADLSYRPDAELNGYGPVIADIARQVAEAEGTKWQYSVADGHAEPIQTGTTRRRPDSDQRRHVESRTPVCAFPGCRAPAVNCDLDHTTPWSESGVTDSRDMTPLCRHDHVIRHRIGWSYERLPRGGHRWTSPLGHTYVTNPAPP